jgi:hypothetical protein
MHDSPFIGSNWCQLAPVICLLYPLLSLAASDDSVGGLDLHSMHLLGTGLACNLTGLTGVQHSLVVSPWSGLPLPRQITCNGAYQQHPPHDDRERVLYVVVLYPQ